MADGPVDTRNMTRAPVKLKIKFRSATLGQFIERYSVDVSKGGIFIRTKDPLEVGTKLKFEFQLQDGSPLIIGDGTVVWIREHDPARKGVAPGMGVRFDELDANSQKVLQEILTRKAGGTPVSTEALPATARGTPGASAPASSGAAPSAPAPSAPAPSAPARPMVPPVPVAGHSMSGPGRPPEVEPKAEEPKAEEPKSETPKVDKPKAEEPKSETPKVDKPKAEEPKAEVPKAEEPKSETRKSETSKVDKPKAEEPRPAAGAPKGSRPSPSAPSQGDRPVEAQAAGSRGLKVLISILLLVLLVVAGYFVLTQTGWGKRLTSGAPSASGPSVEPGAAQQRDAAPAEPEPRDAGPGDATTKEPAHREAPVLKCEDGTLSDVSSEPVGGKIFLDDQEQSGLTPAKICLPKGKGKYTVRVELDRYKPGSFYFRAAQAGEPIAITLEPIVYRIAIRSNPRGAEVFVNGESLKRTTTTSFNMDPGAERVTVTLRKAGYADVEQVVDRGEVSWQKQHRYSFLHAMMIRMTRTGAPIDPEPTGMRPTPREEPMDAAPREEPMDVAPREEPMDVAPREEPMRAAPREEPMRAAPREEPMRAAPRQPASAGGPT